MRRDAKLCKVCHDKQKTKPSGVSKERRERFELALQAGWTLEDIFGYDPDEEYDPDKDKLPTMNEIVARLIKNWWAMSYKARYRTRHNKEGESGTSD